MEEQTFDPKTVPHPLVGKRVLLVRNMTVAEAEREGWEFNRRHGAPHVIVFEDGSTVYASRDDEGNGPGVLFGIDPRLGTIRV